MTPNGSDFSGKLIRQLERKYIDYLLQRGCMHFIFALAVEATVQLGRYPIGFL